MVIFIEVVTGQSFSKVDVAKADQNRILNIWQLLTPNLRVIATNKGNKTPPSSSKPTLGLSPVKSSNHA